MALKKDHELFDSAKKYRAAATAGLGTKLTTLQKHMIAINGAVLSMYMNKVRDGHDLAIFLTQLKLTRALLSHLPLEMWPKAFWALIQKSNSFIWSWQLLLYEKTKCQKLSRK